LDYNLKKVDSHYFDLALPQTALIPGKFVLEHFSKTSADHLALSLGVSQVSEPPWNNYFGTEKILLNSQETIKQQENEEKY